MWKSLLSIFRVPDLRRKVLYTLFFIAIFRLAAHITTPFVDPQALANFWQQQRAAGQGIFSMVDMFTGGAFSQMTVLALGIMPYISASIILQLLMVVWPRLEKIAKEGEAGQKKITQYTRYGTVLLAAFQSLGLGMLMLQQGWTTIPDQRMLFLFTTMLAMTTGTTFLMWLGERITEKGIGNGISLIIALGILAGYPGNVVLGYTSVVNDVIRPIWVPILAATFVVISVSIILMQEGARKIPIQHAKRVVGRRVLQGGTNYLPLKVNTAGVIPPIFASAILTFPSILLGWVGSNPEGRLTGLSSWFDMVSVHNVYNGFGLEKGGIWLILKAVNLHTVLYCLLVIFFCYFYTAITFNPQDAAENLKKYGSFIPGRRPGKPTADYIDYVLTRITLVGAIFLVVVSVLPQVVYVAFEIPWGLTDFVGGTGLIIVVGVILDTMKQIESQLLMRHYEGFKMRRAGSWTRRAKKY
jgi:preprotein translocase subunit SecY